jgi:hypothetical protein
MEAQKMPWCQSNLEQKSKSNAGGIIIPDFKLYYRAMRGTGTNADKEQWNRIDDSEINPHNYSHMTLNKGTKNTLEKR